MQKWEKEEKDEKAWVLTGIETSGRISRTRKKSMMEQQRDKEDLQEKYTPGIIFVIRCLWNFSLCTRSSLLSTSAAEN